MLKLPESHAVSVSWFVIVTACSVIEVVLLKAGKKTCGYKAPVFPALTISCVFPTVKTGDEAVNTYTPVESLVNVYVKLVPNVSLSTSSTGITPTPPDALLQLQISILGEPAVAVKSATACKEKFLVEG